MMIGGFDGTTKENLSALADGELDSGDCAASCEAWAGDAGLRADWHAWHLIGDVLRSEDLAADPRADRRLAAALRVRLRSEAVVLAPARLIVPSVDRPRTRPGRWTAAGAVAAGALLVVGTFAVIRPSESPLAPAVALNSPAGLAPAVPAVQRAPAGELAAPTVAVVADSKLIRDAQLDRYLDAHKQFAGSSALGVPSAFLRGATVDSASR